MIYKSWSTPNVRVLDLTCLYSPSFPNLRTNLDDPFSCFLPSCLPSLPPSFLHARRMPFVSCTIVIDDIPFGTWRWTRHGVADWKCNFVLSYSLSLSSKSRSMFCALLYCTVLYCTVLYWCLPYLLPHPFLLSILDFSISNSCKRMFNWIATASKVIHPQRTFSSSVNLRRSLLLQQQQRQQQRRQPFLFFVDLVPVFCSYRECNTADCQP